MNRCQNVSSRYRRLNDYRSLFSSPFFCRRAIFVRSFKYRREATISTRCFPTIALPLYAFALQIALLSCPRDHREGIGLSPPRYQTQNRQSPREMTFPRDKRRPRSGQHIKYCALGIPVPNFASTYIHDAVLFFQILI